MVYLLGHRSMDEISYGYSFPEWDMSKIEAIDPNLDGGLPFTPYDLRGGYAIRGDHLLTKVQKMVQNDRCQMSNISINFL